MGQAPEAQGIIEGINATNTKIFQGAAYTDIIKALIDQVTPANTCLALNVNPADGGIGEFCTTMTVITSAFAIGNEKTDLF